MKYGVNAFIWSSQFDDAVEAVIPQFRSHGIDGIEVPLIDPAKFEAGRVRKAMEANGLECTVCSVLPSNLSLCTDDAAVHRKTVEHLKTAIQLTAEAGSKLIAGPLYSPVGYLPGRRRTADEWKRVVDGWQQAGTVLEEHGVTVAIEPINRFETYFLNTIQDGVALCDAIAVPRVGLLFDTFHANIEEKNADEALRSIGKHLKHLHTCENDRGTPGSGHIPWKSFFATVDEIGYDGWLTIESFGFSLGELSAAASIWRDLAPSAEQIAYDGVKFIRSSVHV